MIKPIFVGIAVPGLRMFLALYQTKSASSGNDNGFEFDQNMFIAYVQRKAKFINSNKIKAGSSRERKFSYPFFSNKDETQLGIR